MVCVWLDVGFGLSFSLGWAQIQVWVWNLVELRFVFWLGSALGLV